MRDEGLERFELAFLATGLTSKAAHELETDKITERQSKTPAGYNMRGGRKLVFFGPKRRMGRPVAVVVGGGGPKRPRKELFNALWKPPSPP